MSREKEMVHCTAGHSSNNIIVSIKIDSRYYIKHIADGRYGSIYSAILKNGLKWYWNFNKHNWEYSYVDIKFALKEINNSRHDLSGFLKESKYSYSHGLHNSSEDIKSGKSQESQECIDWEEKIQNHAKKRSFSTLDCDSQESYECINLEQYYKVGTDSTYGKDWMDVTDWMQHNLVNEFDYSDETVQIFLMSFLDDPEFRTTQLYVCNNIAHLEDLTEGMSASDCPIILLESSQDNNSISL
ncbi:10291_t:CDS:2 [Diversispora eburnea]|uniref:10291_t:CDS:1 n=1 Tax=Diversispora eburnea TaxID=1213867 RepID=A0A9N8VB59_9GLOM|nr:10291_t:CDS:2 [Diversispora eburnea]